MSFAKAQDLFRLAEWMASDLSHLDLSVIQIDGLHMDDNLLMLAAVGVDADGQKHPLGVIEGATENSATVQALLDNLIERGLDPEVCRLFIVDGAKALAKAIRRTFGADIPIQRCQVHKARNITDRLDPKRHAADSRLRAPHPAAGLGDGRRRQGRTPSPQSGPAPRTRGTGGVEEHPRRHR